MKYEDLEQTDPKTQKVIASIMEKAELKELNSEEDYEKFIFVLMREYARYKVEVDDLSQICKLLFGFSEKQFAGSELSTHLLSGKDISEKMRTEPYEAGLILTALMNYGESLREKLYSDKYSFLLALDREERAAISEYLEMLKLSNLNSLRDVQILFLAIMQDLMAGTHTLENTIKLSGGINKLCETLPEGVRNDQFIRELAEVSGIAAKTTELHEWSENSRQMVSLYNETKKNRYIQAIPGGRHIPPADATRGNDPR